MLHFGVRITCRAFGLWDGPGLPLLLPVQTCNTVFLASWACACRASYRLAHPVPEISENSRVGVPTDHWSMPLFWHPDFRFDCPLTSGAHGVPFILLMRALFPDFPDHYSLEPTLLCSEPNAWNESAIEFAAFSFFVSDFRINI